MAIGSTRISAVAAAEYDDEARGQPRSVSRDLLKDRSWEGLVLVPAVRLVWDGPDDEDGHHLACGELGLRWICQ